MESRGLICRSDSPDDRRGTLAALTPAGLLAIQEAAPGHVTAIRRCFVDLLTDEEIATITSISQRVSAAVAHPATDGARAGRG
jgi:DNA-binding MarR family transcriptional regulator